MFSRNKVFRDPVHGLINITKKDSFLVALINTPEFQRLHRVRQLGVASLTFPGADHTRFSHSLGVLHIASRIIDILRSRYRDGDVEGLLDKYQHSIKAAALLHDVGHGPFSHLVERAFGSHNAHEERTVKMITEEESQLKQVLLDTGQNSTDVKQIISKQFRCVFLQDIVSSQLDADRMDYLIRDSHFAGVQYGIFDLEWVLNCLCLGSYGQVSANGLRLCLDRGRGLQAAEQLILARQHMSLQVYYHRSTRRWEATFLCLIREAVKLADEDTLPKNTPDLLRKYFTSRGNVDHSEFLRIDEPMLMASFSSWRDACAENHQWLATLSTAFLERKKALCRIDIPEEMADDKVSLLKKRFKKEFGDLGDSRWELDEAQFTPYKAPDPSLKTTDPEGYDEGVYTSSIFLSSGDPVSQAVPVSEDSEIFKLLALQKFRLRRLYCDPALKNRVEEIVRSAITP